MALIKSPPVAGATFLLLCILAFLTWQQHSVTLSQWIPAPYEEAFQEESNECAALDQLRQEIPLPQRIKYARRIIQAEQVKRLSDDSLVDLEERLFPEFRELDINDPGCMQRESSSGMDDKPIVIEYERPRKAADTSALLIGASTSLDRFTKVIPQMARWLAPKKASLVVNIHDGYDTLKLNLTQQMARAAGIDATLLYINDHPPDNEDHHATEHFKIVKLLHRQRQKHHKWFLVIDDDTFFPNLSELARKLEQYDHMKGWYIGALAENWYQVAVNFGYMAYGGGGIIFSGTILDVLFDNFDDCLEDELEGDQLYASCIYTYASPPVRLTVMHELNQADYKKDASGFYEAGLRPLSFHHYNTWHRYAVQYGHMVSDVCGPDCFLQRYRFADDVVLTNGYSVAHYPGGTSEIDFDRFEDTFRAKDPAEYLFSLGTLRPRLPAEQKVSWRLEYALETPNSLRQFYIKRFGDDLIDQARLKADVESVLEIVWRF